MDNSNNIIALPNSNIVNNLPESIEVLVRVRPLSDNEREYDLGLIIYQKN